MELLMHINERHPSWQTDCAQICPPCCKMNTFPFTFHSFLTLTHLFESAVIFYHLPVMWWLRCAGCYSADFVLEVINGWLAVSRMLTRFSSVSLFWVILFVASLTFTISFCQSRFVHQINDENTQSVTPSGGPQQQEHFSHVGCKLDFI